VAPGLRRKAEVQWPFHHLAQPGAHAPPFPGVTLPALGAEEERCVCVFKIVLNKTYHKSYHFNFFGIQVRNIKYIDVGPPSTPSISGAWCHVIPSETLDPLKTRIHPQPWWPLF
jgi:hypothetical protein